MPKEVKQPPKLEKFCHFHENNLATFICGNCGKSICYYCQKNYTMPYLCPECMPVWWEKRVKRERILCFGPVVAIILIIIIFVAYSILTYEEYDDYDYDYSSIYVEDEGIIPILDTSGNSGSNDDRLDLTLKVYATNEGNKDTGNVYIELYIMQNGTSRAQANSETKVIKKEKTNVFYINTTILKGDYELQFMIWEDGKVVEKGVKSVRITKGDIQNIKAYEILEEEEPAKMAEDKEAGSADGFSTGPYVLLPFLIIAVIILPILAWVFYQIRIKPPSQRQGQGQGQMPMPLPPHKR